MKNFKLYSVLTVLTLMSSALMAGGQAAEAAAMPGTSTRENDIAEIKRLIAQEDKNVANVFPRLDSFLRDYATIIAQEIKKFPERQISGYLATMARLGGEREVSILLLAGADPNTTYRRGTHEMEPGQLSFPLLDAAQRGNLTLVKLLLNAKADINKVDEHGITPLMLAAYHGRKAIVQALLDAGADASIIDNQKITALKFAEIGYYPEIISLLSKAPTKVKKA